jgi:hypothetical protein
MVEYYDTQKVFIAKQKSAFCSDYHHLAHNATLASKYISGGDSIHACRHGTKKAV